MTGSSEPPRWLGVGYSAASDAHGAGHAAACEAMRGDDPKLVIVFCSDSYELDELLAGVNEGSGHAPLIGCSTAGQIATDGPGDASVAVTVLGGEGFTVTTAAAGGASSGLREAGARVARCAFEHNGAGAHHVMMLLSDGLGGDQQDVIRGAYGVLGAGVPLVGGCAGDDLKMEVTYQLHGTEVLRDAIVGASIGSSAPFGIGVRHGWRKVDEPVLVTRSEGNRVYELDDRPALDVYLERLEVPEHARRHAAAFSEFAITHPLGLDRRSSEQAVRMVAGADFDERSLTMIAQVPQGGLAWFMEGDEESVLDATDDACSAALSMLGGERPLGLIAFDCVARRGVLGDPGIRREVERVAQHAGGVPVAGFYSYGEIARTTGISGFHNQTLVVLAVA